MMDKNKKKADQLGMPIGTASARLRKMILFDIPVKSCKLVCYQCGEHIWDIDDLSIEHKIPWLDSESPIKLFFDLDNIAYSHLSCNVSAARQNKEKKFIHGTITMYKNHKCKCILCRKANAELAYKRRLGV